MLCASCGSKGIHIGCGRLDWSTMEWDCEDCSLLESRQNSASRATGSSTLSMTANATVPTAAEVLAPPRTGVKRPRPLDFSSSEDGSGDEISEIDIVSVSDSELPLNSITTPIISMISVTFCTFKSVMLFLLSDFRSSPDN